MTDLTKITSAFGLLDAETQEALRAHGGPYETWQEFCGEVSWEVGWLNTAPVTKFYPACVYRVKPQPPKPREGWFYLNQMFETESAAQDFRAILAADNGQSYLEIPISRWREVLPDE